VGLIFLILKGIRLIVLLDIIFSWVIRDPNQFPRSLTRQITAPLYAPIHAILDPRKTGGFDLAPLIILLLLGLIAR